MKSIATSVLLLAIAAVSSQAAPVTGDAALSGIPLNVAKRLHQLPTPSGATADVMLSGIPMRTATLPMALRSVGKPPDSLCPVELTGVSMAKATRPRAQGQPEGGRSDRTC
jgi:hypothetical protein